MGPDMPLTCHPQIRWHPDQVTSLARTTLTLLDDERNKLLSAAIPARLGRAFAVGGPAFAEVCVPDPRFISHRVENTTRRIPTEFR
jgi:hypothetical protein